MSSDRRATQTGGRPATTAVIPGRYALSVGKPDSPAPDGWWWVPLTDLARLESGHTPSRKKPEYWNGSIPWIGIRDATANHGRVIYDTAQHTNELGIANSSARLLPAHTVCLSRTASVGYVLVTGRPMATSQDFVNWICSDQLDWRFLKYVLLAERESILRFAYGTTHQTIYFPEVKAFHLCKPPLDQQRRIASVLGALDDKIEHNNGMELRLAQLLSARFRSLFGAALNGAVVPDRWKRGVLSDEVHIVMGQSPPGTSYSADRSAGLPLIQGKSDLGERYPNPTRFTTSVTKRIERGDVIFTVRAPVGVINIADRSYCAGRGVAALRSDRPVYAEQLLRALASRWNSEESGTIFPAVNRQQIAGLEIVVPPREATEDFDAANRPIYDLIGSLSRERANLTAIRDTLLPKLVSGSIRVPDSYDPDDALGTAAEAGVAVP